LFYFVFYFFVFMLVKGLVFIYLFLDCLQKQSVVCVVLDYYCKERKKEQKQIREKKNKNK